MCGSDRGCRSELDPGVGVLGVDNDDGGAPLAQIYDGDADGWREGPPMLEALDHLASVVHDGKIWVTAGKRANPISAKTGEEGAERSWKASPSNLFAVFDPAADAWTPLEPLPFPRCAVQRLGDLLGFSLCTCTPSPPARDLTRTGQSLAPRGWHALRCRTAQHATPGTLLRRTCHLSARLLARLTRQCYCTRAMAA